MKGIEYQFTYQGYTGDGSQTLHYVNLPVLLKAKVKRMFFETGPQVSILLASMETTKLDTPGKNAPNPDQATFNTNDFGYALGLGYQAQNGVMLGLRYNGGLSNVMQSIATRNGTLQQDARNSAFQLYAGYMFGNK